MNETMVLQPDELNIQLNDKMYVFLESFEKRVRTTPTGSCPISVLTAYLQNCVSQSCGKCVPCRDGLKQLQKMMENVQNGTASMETFEEIRSLAGIIADTADCAIGYDAGRVIRHSTDVLKEEYLSHILEKKCQAGIAQKVPCISMCPANVDVPGYVSLVGEGRPADAINLIRQDNPFPTACAFICEHPCEERCRRGLLDAPVNIRGIKKYAVDTMPADRVKTPECGVPTGKTIAVVGGGPSGLTAAYFLALMGHKAVVFEERAELGGMLRYGIPNYRLPKDRLDQDIRAVLHAGDITVHLNTVIGKDITMDQLRADYDAVYLAIGAQTGKTLRMEGVNLQGVSSAVDMLGEIGNGRIPDYSGKKVIIVGGGNVAMDAARSAIRCNAEEVTIVYRRRQEDMTALPSEIQGAIQEGVELLLMHAPVRVLGDSEGKVCGFVAQPQIIGEYDRGGRPSVSNAADKEEITLEAQIILLAIGQDIVSGPFAEYNVHERRKTFGTTPETDIPGFDGVFAGGDCVFGPATVIKAIGAGKVAALNIDRYLGYHHTTPNEIKAPAPKENERRNIGRVNLTERSAKARRQDFEPVEKEMSWPEACQESRRCLRCDHFGCGAMENGRI